MKPSIKVHTASSWLYIPPVCCGTCVNLRTNFSIPLYRPYNYTDLCAHGFILDSLNVYEWACPFWNNTPLQPDDSKLK